MLSAWSIIMSLALTGCGSTRFAALRSEAEALAKQERQIIQASLSTPIIVHETPRTEPGHPIATLSVDGLVAEVLAKNPSLSQMVAAWQAASARYPQVRALDDPSVGAMFAPASFGSNTVDSGYRIEVSQKLPIPGKLRLRGQGALAEAAAARNDVDDMRVQLVESTKLAYYEYFLVDRAIAVNDEALKLLGEFKQNAEARSKTGLAPPQDILQADVEIGRQRERAVTLERMRKIAIARINTLRSSPPEAALARPPQELKAAPQLTSVANLRDLALANRPDLKAIQERIAVDEAALKLSLREYLPDVELTAAYDTIMGNGPMRDLASQVGIRMNLPIRFARRSGAVAEAHAKIAQRHAEYTAHVNQIQFQVQEAFEQLVESERILALYEKTILPAARENVKAAQAAYVTGKTPFLSLIEAQRSLVNLRDRNYEAMADYFRRHANLERAIGGPIEAGSSDRASPKK